QRLDRNTRAHSAQSTPSWLRLSRPSPSPCSVKARMAGTRPALTTQARSNRTLRYCRPNRPPGHHADQMRTGFRPAMDVARHAVIRDGHPFERLRAEALLERLFERRHAEDTVRSSPGHRNADLRAALGDEHADQRKTGGRIGKFYVAGLVHFRELHLG